MKRITIVPSIAAFALLLPSIATFGAGPEIRASKIDFLPRAHLSTNGAGPHLLALDTLRNRLFAANTLSSSVSIIGCSTREVEVIPTGGRSLQHLKSEALAIRSTTGELYLIGDKCFSVVDPDRRQAQTLPTKVQFESVAVDETSGNAFLVGRESKEISFFDASSRKISLVPWLEKREDLVNLNATPPPPIRKAVAAPELQAFVAIDGYTSTFYLFDGRSANMIVRHETKISRGGRWHLAGYDETNHRIYLVIETDSRRVIEAARVNVLTGETDIIALPGFTEAVGVRYNRTRDEVYIPYDNHASVHVVAFSPDTIAEIALPAYGNDASALDETRGILYIGSWAHGEVDVIDLESRKLKKRIENLGIIPHQFTMVHEPELDRLYYPKGATAVNGTFGSAITELDPKTGKTTKILTAWAPIDIISVPSRATVLVFDNEDEFAEVRGDLAFEVHKLPFDYPICAASGYDGNIYLSYGPHQSYWPVVYIWGAKNGILRIDASDLSFYDRRIPRQAQKMVFDSSGRLYFTQNNWGSEQQFVGMLPDGIRLFDIGQRIALPDTVQREITQRILEYDSLENRLYLVRLPEEDENESIFQAIDLQSRALLHSAKLGRTTTDLVFDDRNIYAANFDSRSVTVLDKQSFQSLELRSKGKPLDLCIVGKSVWAANQETNSLWEIREGAKEIQIPYRGNPDNLFAWKNRLIVTSHSERELCIIAFDPLTRRFSLVHREEYPYGDTSFDTRNVSFYLPGQYGDAVFRITEAAQTEDGRLWIADFLSGKLFVLESK